MELFPLVVEIEAFQMTGAWNLALPHPAHEKIILPVRELVAGVEAHAGNRNGRHPKHYGRLHSFLPRIDRYPRSQIEPTVADHRPAVVLARLKNIDFVAAVGSVLAFPDVTRDGMDGESQRITMSQRKNLGAIARAADKRIVWGNRSIVPQPQGFARQVVRILRGRRRRWIADPDRHIHHAIFPEHDPRRVAALDGREKIADVGERWGT